MITWIESETKLNTFALIPWSAVDFLLSPKYEIVYFHAFLLANNKKCTQWLIDKLFPPRKKCKKKYLNALML